MTATTIGTTTMRAVTQDRYGGADVLRVAVVERPAPGAHEVLVRVHAASLNARDWHVMRGEPRIARLMDKTVFARRGPRVAIRGTDFAGVVEAVGAAVTTVAVGDRVFGEAAGTLAEYVVAPEDAVALLPSAVSFTEGAAVPLAATTAWLCLRDAAVEPGGRVVINGASGGVGSFAVQLAKSQGLHVTAVCSARNADLARRLGADVVVDYRREDFCATGQRYDAVIDLVGNRALRDLRRVLRPDGRLVLSGGGVPGEGRVIGPISTLVRAQLLARFTSVRVALPSAKPRREHLDEIAGLLARGLVVPVIDRLYPLEQAATALHYMETQHARAKVVVAVRGTADGAGVPD